MSLVPFVGGIASFIGFGAVVLLVCRVLRGTTETDTASSPLVAPSAS